MTLAYHKGDYFITDTGESLVLTDEESRSSIRVPRYGLWISVRGRAVVLEVSDDLDDLKNRVDRCA